MSRCFLKTKNKNRLLHRGKTIISSVNKIEEEMQFFLHLASLTKIHPSPRKGQVSPSRGIAQQKGFK